MCVCSGREDGGRGSCHKCVNHGIVVHITNTAESNVMHAMERVVSCMLCELGMLTNASSWSDCLGRWYRKPGIVLRLKMRAYAFCMTVLVMSIPRDCCFAPLDCSLRKFAMIGMCKVGMAGPILFAEPDVQIPPTGGAYGSSARTAAGSKEAVVVLVKY